MERLKRGAGGLLKLLYPRRAECMGCGSKAGCDRDWLCEDCRRGLSERWLGATPPPEDGRIVGMACAFRYNGPVAGVVHNLKYRGVRELAGPMGRHMVQALAAIRPVDADCVVPVPMHRRRLARRGFNHAELLAGQAADRLGLPMLEALERTRNTPQQARLDDALRRENIKGAFALRADVRDRQILLVDDVCTTGATANACAQALLEGGAKAVYLLCYARAGEKGSQ